MGLERGEKERSLHRCDAMCYIQVMPDDAFLNDCRHMVHSGRTSPMLEKDEPLPLANEQTWMISESTCSGFWIIHHIMIIMISSFLTHRGPSCQVTSTDTLDAYVSTLAR